MITRDDLETVVVFAEAALVTGFPSMDARASIERIRKELDWTLPPDVAEVVWTRASEPRKAGA